MKIYSKYITEHRAHYPELEIMPLSIQAQQQFHEKSPNINNFYVSYFLYPSLLVSLLMLFMAAQFLGWNLATVFAWYGGGRFIVLILAEFIWPAKIEWKMNWPSFRRDLKYVIINGSFAGLMSFSIAWFAIDMSRFNTGVVANSPFVFEFLVLVFVFEFFQYWHHRWSHEGKDPVGAWLWKSHVAHHLPDRVYLLMHVVAHPVNMVFTSLIINLPLVVLGARPEVIFLYNALMGLQGLVSHFNVDIKAGWLNYVLVGTELHRFHHSADKEQAKNYGVMIPFWDLVFGTFRYDPQQLPVALGVHQPSKYPESSQIFQVMALPFKTAKAKPPNV